MHLSAHKIYFSACYWLTTNITWQPRVQPLHYRSHGVKLVFIMKLCLNWPQPLDHLTTTTWPLDHLTRNGYNRWLTKHHPLIRHPLHMKMTTQRRQTAADLFLTSEPMDAWDTNEVVSKQPSGTVLFIHDFVSHMSQVSKFISGKNTHSTYTQTFTP